MWSHQARLFFIALQFLTRVPAPRAIGFDPAWLRASARYFPLVGAVVGAAGVAALGAGRWLWNDAIAAGLSLATTAWLTGAFHEDGLADTLDGLGGAHDKARALAIMKDSRIGTYGSVGLLLVLGLKAAALAAWSARAIGDAALLLVWAHAASRLVPVWLMHALPYAGDAEHAKAKPLATSSTRAELLVAAGTVAALALLVAWLSPALARPLAGATLGAILVGASMRRWLARRLGGFTGDTLGAAQQLAELAVLLAALAVAARGGAPA
jgi:adenosylcobinamide-GDP ribazoletransferase